MNVKLKVLTAGVLFFMGGEAVMAQKSKKDSVETKSIDEVVVVGYQKKTKDMITQAQSIVTSEELKTQTPSTGIGNMLQGRASGVFIQSRNGQPGATAEINIRNISGFDGNSEPAYVVDGIYMTARQFNAINSNDVESIVILKDAAAVSQYGSRGANGVVVVTTRKGIVGKTQYFFESRLGFTQRIKDKELNFDLMNAEQKLRYESEMRALGLTGLPAYTSTQIDQLIAQNHDWREDLSKNGILQSYLISANGGSDKSNFYYSLGYDKDEGIIKYINGLDRYTARFNFENKLSNKLKVGVDIGGSYQYTQDVRDRNNVQSPFGAAYRYNPFEPVYNADGSYNFNLRQGFNIVEALQNNLNYDQRLRLNSNIHGEYSFNKSLSYKVYFNTLYDNLVNTVDLKRGSQLDLIVNGSGGLGTLTKNTFYSFNYLFGNRIDYKKTLGDSHNFGFTGLVEFNRDFTESINASGTNYKNPYSDAPSTTIPSDKNTFTGSKVKSTLFSMLGLFNYDYQGKYILTGSLRQDKSSKFGKNNREGIFWATSAAWNVAKESFMSNSVFDDLKLRASYGISGNDRNIPNFNNNVYVSYGDYGAGGTLGVTATYGNPDIKWETNKILNLGAEFGVMKRFKGSIEVYRSDRGDFIQQVPLQIENGGYFTYKNLGSMRSEGLEFEFSADVIKSSDLRLTLRGNGSFQRAKVLSLDGTATERNLGETMLKVGETPYIFRLVEYAGVNPANGVALYYTDRTTPASGENFITINGRTATDVYNASIDAKPITDKSPLPKFYGGFGVSFNYKGFDLSSDFNFKTGAYTYNYQTQNLTSSSNRTNNLSVDAFNYWKKPGDTDVYAKPTSVGHRASTQFLEKSDYLRWRTLTIGYTLKGSDIIRDNAPFNSIRIYAQAQNLLTWTAFKGDPEVAVGSGENQLGASQTYVAGSYALFSYPATRQFLFGVQLQF